jgi:hypothetical protein
MNSRLVLLSLIAGLSCAAWADPPEKPGRQQPVLRGVGTHGLCPREMTEEDCRKLRGQEHYLGDFQGRTPLGGTVYFYVTDQYLTATDRIIPGKMEGAGSMDPCPGQPKGQLPRGFVPGDYGLQGIELFHVRLDEEGFRALVPGQVVLDMSSREELRSGRLCYRQEGFGTGLRFQVESLDTGKIQYQQRIRPLGWRNCGGLRIRQYRLEVRPAKGRSHLFSYDLPAFERMDYWACQAAGGRLPLDRMVPLASCTPGSSARPCQLPKESE